MQGVKINGLGLAMISIAIASLGTAFGQAHIDPVAGSVAGALKTAEVDESLRQVERVAVGRLPILAEPPEIESQDLGGKTGDVNPRENEEANVVDDEGQMLASGWGIPSNESIPVLNLKGRAGPAQASYHLAVEKSQVS
jgi:hypothetical protein